jgi:hypothetical protein
MAAMSAPSSVKPRVVIFQMTALTTDSKHLISLQGKSHTKRRGTRK